MSCDSIEFQFSLGALSPRTEAALTALPARQGSALGGSRRPSPCCLPSGSVEAFDRDAHASKEHANWLALSGGARGLFSQIRPGWILSAVECLPLLSLAAFALTKMSITSQSRRPSHSPGCATRQTVLQCRRRDDAHWTSGPSLCCSARLHEIKIWETYQSD